MSRRQPSASQQTKSRRGKGGSGGRPSGNVYLHAVTDGQATLLADTATTRPLCEVEKGSGAHVMLDSKASPVPGMKVVVITGQPSQIHTAVRLISHKTGAQGTLSDQALTFWFQWVEASFPDLDSRAYFLPPVYFNRVPMVRQSVAGQDVLVLQSASGQAGQSSQSVTTPSAAVQTCLPQPPRVQDSDVRDDSAMQRVLFCLRKMTEQKGEVLFAMSNLQFAQYLGEPCYAAAAAQLALPANLPSTQPRNWKQGDFDVLLIHRHYGFVVCEVKAFGDNVHALSMSPQVIADKIRGKLKEAATQLDKAAAMLSHLVSDVTPGLHITKVIAVPNLKADQVKQALSGHKQLTQDLCRCLGTTDPADIPGVCLCCDQLSDPKTPCDVRSHVLRELGHWWQRRVAGAGRDRLMTDAVYRTLVARHKKRHFPSFCNQLLIRVPRLHLWAASCYYAFIPACWQVEYLTRPLRSPPSVVREVEQDEKISKYRVVHPYCKRGVPDHTDGPPVTRLYHRGQGHSGDRPGGCVTCGRDVASFLHSLRVGVTGSVQWNSLPLHLKQLHSLNCFRRHLSKYLQDT
ncbi:uncharacterized protein LOC112575950 isoform X2 [Pomacea canaliculata]|uniref:uncharacterized protein LOC112575950 isoform X2 n=1 Tax=Pomacea canaliculata TaxID=400727 RepID=UPI000D72B81C|nr:uncharacterized protein LOC112575950 isoform X2 [Pomacea canaliculata]